MTSVVEAEPAALYEKRGHVAFVTLNRPRALNAVNSALALTAGEALEQAEKDEDVRVVIITGAGRGFCAGADLKELAQGHSVAAPGHKEWGFAGVCRHWISKPTIAAINGLALGGGTEILLACDLAVIDETAPLGLPEVRRGLFPAAGGVIRLQRQVPLKVALEIALTGESITAHEAKALGLVNRVAPAGTAVEVALHLAESIVAGAPLAVQASKRVIHQTVALGTDLSPEVWAVNTEALKVVFGSQDGREGPTAFAEGRAPRWQGR